MLKWEIFDVIDMSFMFNGVKLFNREIFRDVRYVIDMSFMFVKVVIFD